MSDQAEPAAVEPNPPESAQPAPEPEPAPDAPPTEPEPNPFDLAGRNPLSGSGGTGGSGTAHAARRTFAAGGAERTVEIGGDGQYYEGNYFFQIGAGPVPRLLKGAVPTPELQELGDVYCEAAGYRGMKKRLRAGRLLVLCAERGSGRTATALALLAELTGNRVARLDPSHAVHQIEKEELTKEFGHLLEVPLGDDGRGPGLPTDPPRGPARLSELHLDRLSGLLEETKAYGVVLVESGDLADRVLRGRYGMRCPPPPWRDVLDRHLRKLLKDAPEDIPAAAALADRADVVAALGLDALRPREAARLAGLLARRQQGELSDGQLRDECGTFVRAQARTWFAGADRPGTLPEALPALSAAAFRIAVAVFNGSSYSLTSEAGERLAWELAVTLDPGEPIGRQLFGTHAEDRPAIARSVIEDGELDLGDAQVPVRAIRFQGAALATAVLREVWHSYHNVRGPLARWLRDLCDDPRPLLWVRASIAAGVLCSWDWVHGSAEIIQPMAASPDSAVLRMSAATALAEASREPSVQQAVTVLLKDWAQSGDEALAQTAALTHGYGMAAGSVDASLDALAGLVRDGGAAALSTAAFSLTRLLAGSEPEAVLGRLVHWLHGDRRDLADLVLLTVIGTLKTRTTYLWGLEELPELETQGTRPLAVALLATRPQVADDLAGLVRAGLGAARSGAATLTALGAVLRQAAADEEQLDLVCGFLPQLAGELRERKRLYYQLDRMVGDPEEPLDKTAARRMWDAVREGAES